MPASDQLDRVGDDLAAHQRGLHALGPHRDSVGDGYRVELHRIRARFADAGLERDRQLTQAEIARHRFEPRVRHADEGLLDVLGGQADRVKK